MKLLLCIVVQIVLVNLICSVPLPRTKRNVAVTVINNTEVCVVNRLVFRVGDIIDFEDPCEICRCHPPGFACTYRRCPKEDPALLHPDCKIIRVAGQCCLQYQCPEEEKLLTTEAVVNASNNEATEAKDEETATLESKQLELGSTTAHPGIFNNRNELELTEASAVFKTEESILEITGKLDNGTNRYEEVYTSKSEDETAKSDDVTGKYDDVTGKSEDVEDVTGKSEDFTGKTVDAIGTSEAPNIEIEGRNVDTTEISADLTVASTKLSDEGSKEGRLVDEFNSTSLPDVDIEDESEINGTVDGRSENLAEGTSEAPDSRKLDRDLTPNPIKSEDVKDWYPEVGENENEDTTKAIDIDKETTPETTKSTT